MTKPPITLGVNGPEEQPVVVRTREEVYKRPRSGKAPGRVFGPGFLARLREKQTLAWVLTVFLGLGLWLLLIAFAGLLGIDDLPEGRRSAIAALAWGSFFSLGSLWLFRNALTRAETERRARLNDLPWTWDYPWQPEWMAPDQRPWSGLILGRLAVFALVAVLNLIQWERGCATHSIVIGADILALLLLYDSVRKLLQWLRFRHPVVTWVSLPAFLGESLEGRISFARPVKPDSPVQLVLRCVNEDVRKDSAGEKRRYFFVYTQTVNVHLEGGEPLDFLDFAFELPTDVHGTDFHANDPVYWQVVLKVPVAGPDLEATFMAPVYKKSKPKKKSE